MERSYNYSYDELNRLKKATFRASLNNDKYTEGPITYDKNGNIISLARNGQKSDNSLGLIDNLSYTYFPYSNRLKSVTDGAFNTAGFNNGSTETNDDYKYDANGNMTQDLNKDIGETPDEEITYNYLNLPTKVIVDATHTVEYIYDAAGKKLQKKVTNGVGNVMTTLYAGEFLYENGVLQYFGHAEGYARRESTGTFSYIYQYKDHLGNVRLTYWKNTGTNALEIISTNNYYAFGMEHKGYGVALSTNSAQKIKYNSKELQDELQLNWYDYQARNYDPAIGRWFNIDPLAEKSRRFSPYVYALDNPVYFVDPDGMMAESLDSGDFDVDVDLGYKTVKSSKLSASVSYTVGEENKPTLNSSGKEKIINNMAEYLIQANKPANKSIYDMDDDHKKFYIAEMIKNVAPLRILAEASGIITKSGEVKVDWQEKIEKLQANGTWAQAEGLYSDTTKRITISDQAFINNMSLAIVIVHELVHAFDYSRNGMMSTLAKGGLSQSAMTAITEVRAYEIMVWFGHSLNPEQQDLYDFYLQSAKDTGWQKYQIKSYPIFFNNIQKK
ncbi:RHS repeat-associated core domain-containing protein [Flavobacterium zepuense]|uniref:RHS repeat-associated core domain-containing protein n=1 Tax=Flavobacterium zepuense TaxID=2593302 RepID=A0A552US24_9FLAO|nr:RHS repeat-associated core domain-containing protein [Flavobacterium zepuense]